MDLGAADVELWVALVGGMKGKKLGTSEVIATLEAWGKLDRKTAIGLGGEPFGTPLLFGLVVALVPDLEPAIAGSYISMSAGHPAHVGRVGSLPPSSLAEDTFLRYTAQGPL